MYDSACDAQQGALRPKPEELLYGKWTDAIEPSVQENEKTLFYNALPELVRQDVLEYRQCVANHNQLRRQLREELRDFTTEFFVVDNEADVVRPLASLYGYIHDTEENLLLLNAEDARCADIETPDNTFAILHACEQGQSKTKYQALFYPSERLGATDFRERFFHITDDPDSLAHGVVILEALEQLGEAPQLTVLQRALARRGQNILRQWFAYHSEGAVQWPPSCTQEVGWLALIAAFRKNYWFHYKDPAR